MKHKNILLTLIIAGALVSCGPKVELPSFAPFDYSTNKANVDSNGYTIIDFYGINDFHGAVNYNIDEKQPGIARLSNYLIDKRNDNKGGTMFLSSGDSWQGSAESNITKGKVVNELFNYLTFEAMSVGNHEFDWGIETLINNKADLNAALLGANVVYKGTKDRLEGLDSSVLLERDGVKIGVIGTIGSNLEYSIKTSLISDIEFDNIETYVQVESNKLKEQGANIIVLLDHDTWINPTTDKLNTVKYVDLVISGHEHKKDSQLIEGVPVLQTDAYGQQVMHAQFGYNKNTKELLLKSSSVSQDLTTLNLTEDQVSKKILNYYNSISNINKIRNEVIGKLTDDFSKIKIANLTVRAMHDFFKDNNDYRDKQVVGAIHNINGGIRVNSFNKGNLTYGRLYEALPFDNEIVLMLVYGNSLKDLISAGGNNSSYFSINRNEVESTTSYYVATIDYLYERDYIDRYSNRTNTFELTREVTAKYVRSVKTLDPTNY